MPKTALLCPPTYFDVLDMKNPYMLGESPVDKQKARQQWEALRRALETAGVQIATIDPVPGLEDMVFAANQVFVGHHAKIGKFIVPSHMRFASRQREVAHYVEWFRARGYKVIEVDFGDEYLEGSGDLIWHPDRSRIYAGHAFRSTVGGIRHLDEAMQKLGIPVVALELMDERFYHLDTCFCPLSNEAVLIFPGAFARAIARSTARLLAARARDHGGRSGGFHRKRNRGQRAFSDAASHGKSREDTGSGEAQAAGCGDVRIRKVRRELFLHEEFHRLADRL